MVKRALVFTMDALARYPMETRQAFIECGGNSAALYAEEPVQGDVQQLHGLVSCAEWTGAEMTRIVVKPDFHCSRVRAGQRPPNVFVLHHKALDPAR